MRIAPRGHTDDSRALLIDGLAKATELDQAEGARRVDTMQAVPSALKTGTPQCREGCGEMACTAGDDLPGLPALTRARLVWQRFVCGFRR